MALRNYMLIGAIGFLLNGIVAFFPVNAMTILPLLLSIVAAIILSLFFYAYFQRTDDNLVKISSIIGFVAYLIMLLGHLITLIGMISVNPTIFSAASGVLLTADLILAIVLVLSAFRLIVLHNKDIVMVVLCGIVVVSLVISIFVHVLFPVSMLGYGATLGYMFYRKLTL